MKIIFTLGLFIWMWVVSGSFLGSVLISIILYVIGWLIRSAMQPWAVFVVNEQEDKKEQ